MAPLAGIVDTAPNMDSNRNINADASLGPVVLAPATPPGDRGPSCRLKASRSRGKGDSPPTVKCVLVGDGAVGKTSLLAGYAASESQHLTARTSKSRCCGCANKRRIKICSGYRLL